MKLLTNLELERSDIPANCLMNREREIVGRNSYSRDLYFDILDHLSGLIEKNGNAVWLDMCCGTGRALIQAGRHFVESGNSDDMTIIGVDLIDMFNPIPEHITNVAFVESSLTDFTPDRSFDLITCVHGLHYIGDKMGLIARASSWLTDEGLFCANLDLANLRDQESKSMTRSFRRYIAGTPIEFDSRRHLLTCHGKVDIDFSIEYLGADDKAGPNYTGQSAVDSYYRLI